MPRSNHSRRGNRRAGRSGRPTGEPAPLRLPGLQRSETHPDGEWLVRSVSGSDSGRAYRCPGCQQQVLAATPHIVAWPADGPVGAGAGVDSRRHWHTPCWTARSRRRPR